MAGTVVEHKKFICVEFGETNNNKYWQYTIYDDGTALTEWGRVGGRGDSLVTTSEKAYKKMREKTNTNNAKDKLYTEVKAIDGSGSTAKVTAGKASSVELRTIAAKQIIVNDPTVKKFVEWLVDVNAHQIHKATGGGIQYDTSTAQFKTPMGIIMPDMVADARQYLFELAKLVQLNKHKTDDFSENLNQYLRKIPHAVGMRKIDPYEILPDMAAIQKENDILDGLDASFNDATNATKKDDGKAAKIVDEPKLFDAQLHLINDKKIIDHCRKLFVATKKSMHQSSKYDVKDVYEVVINHMSKAYDAKGKMVGNIMQLWHGTKCSNLLSILKHGLIIPPSNSGFCTGRMFGDGLYFSDQSTKALNYATNYWGSGGNTSRVFMFLADVAMGKMYTPNGSGSYGYPRSGYDSTFAKAGSSGVMNNEMIVYKCPQANLRYLVEFK